MAVSDIIVKFGADMTALKAGFAEANKGTGDFESRMKSMGGTATAAGGAMTAGLTVPIMAIAAFAMKSASDVGGAFKTIEKSTGATGAQLDVLKGSFRDVFGNFPISADDAAKVVSKVSTTLKSLNGDVPATQAQITAVSGAFEQFAKVGGVDVSTATDTLMRSFKAMGLSADEVKPALNDITVAAQSTGDNTQRLIDSVSKAAPTFKEFGFGIEDTSAVMAKLDMSGVKSQAVVTGLNKVLKEAAASGIPPKKALADLEDQMKKGNITGAEAATMYKELGVKGFAQFSTAVKGGAFDVQDLTNKMSDNAGAMEKSYNDTLTFGDRLTMFRNKLEIAFQPLGSAIFDVLGNVLDAMTPVLNIVTKLAMAFSNMPKGIQTIVVIIGGLLAALGPVLLIVGKLMTSFTQIQGVVTKLAPAIEKMAGPLLKAAGGTTQLASKIPGLGALGGGAEGGGMAEMLAPVLPMLGPILIAVAAIAAVFAVLYATSGTFRDVVAGILGKFQELFAWAGKFVGVLTSGNLGGAMDMLKKAIGDVGNMFATINWAGIGQTIIKVFSESFGTISGMAGHAFDTLHDIDWGGMFAGALDAVSGFLDTLLNFDPTPMINSLIDAIGGAFDSLFGGSGAAPAAGSKGDVGGKVSKGVEKAGPDILSKLEGVFIKLLALLPTIFGKIAIALGTALSKVDWGKVFGMIGALLGKILGPAVSGAFSGAGDFLGKLFGGAADAIKKFLGQLADGAKTYLGGFGQWMWNAIITIFKLDVKFYTAVINAFKDFGTKLYDLIKTGLSGFGAFLISAVGGAVNAVKTGFNTAVNTVKTVLTGAVTTAVNFLSTGWNTVVNTVRSVLGSAVSTAVSSLSSGWNTVVNTVRNVLGSAVTTAVNSLKSGWTTVVNTVKSVLGSAVSTAVSGLTSGWNNAVNTVKSVLGSAVSSAVNTLTSGFNTAVNTIKNGISTAMTTLSTAATNFGKSVIDGISGLGSEIGRQLSSAIDGAKSAFTGIGEAIVNGFRNLWNSSIGGKGFSFDTHIPGVGTVGFTIPNIAQGAVVGAAQGGRIVRVAEAGEMEAIVPGHRIGEDWDSLLHGPNALQSLAKGAVIGNVSLPSTTGRATPAAVKQGDVYNYNSYVTVDSEDITRKVFKAFRNNEDYNNLGRM